MADNKEINNLSADIFSNPAYFGKHVVVVNGEVHEARTGEEAVKILEEVRKKYPDKQPTLTYIPEEETLILFFYGKTFLV
ncbi:MAG TPA: DUF5678 domain-containing protein [Candidatus Paceibacterota bacterium]